MKSRIQDTLPLLLSLPPHTAFNVSRHFLLAPDEHRASMEERLVEFVCENKILYDKSCRAYKYTATKERKWQEVANKLNTTVDAVKKRWKTLRDKFYRETKSLEKPSENGYEWKSPWKYYDMMLFLQESKEDRTTTTNFNENDSDSLLEVATEEGETYEVELLADFYDPSPESTVWPAENLSASPESISAFQRSRVKEAAVVSKPITASNVPSEHPNSTPRYPSRNASLSDLEKLPRNSRKRKMSDNTLIKDTFAEISSLISAAKESISRVTTTTAFFNSMALLVDERNLPPDELSRLRQTISDIVHKAIE